MPHDTYTERLHTHPAYDPVAESGPREYEYKDTKWHLHIVGENGFFEITYADGKPCPDEVAGSWTNPILAEQAIEKYVNSAPKKQTPYEVKPKKVKLTPKETPTEA